MYGLPASFDPAAFAGRDLDQVSFTANTVTLTFSGHAAITMEGAWEVRLAEGDALVREVWPMSCSRLPGLAGRRVVEARRMGQGSLGFLLEGGGELVCLEDSEQYESYSIRLGGEEIVV